MTKPTIKHLILQSCATTDVACSSRSSRSRSRWAKDVWRKRRVLVTMRLISELSFPCRGFKATLLSQANNTRIGKKQKLFSVWAEVAELRKAENIQNQKQRLYQRRWICDTSFIFVILSFFNII